MIEQNINLRASSTLSITPRLQQAISLLQFSSTDINAFINEQACENPLLIVTNADNHLEILPEKPQEFSKDCDDESPQNLEEHAREYDINQNPRLKCEQTLQEYLQLQLSLKTSCNIEYHIGLALIHCLNSNGYLDIDSGEIASQLGVSLKLVDRVIAICQSFDPAGIFAKNVEECLRIQIQKKGLLTPEFDLVIKNIDGLLHQSPNHLAKKCSISFADLQNYLYELRQLNPRPASAFLTNNTSDHIIPDGFIKRNQDGRFSFELNSKTVPQVLFDTPYYNELRKKLNKVDERQFIQAKFTHANWLIQALHQRLITLERVASAITNHQHDFFLNGIGHLKPLTLKMIADQLDVHESTVSRITTAKYISTPRGTFELKFFFSQSLTSISDGKNDVSSKSVQNAILNLVNSESEDNPLSDEQLVAKLGESGMLIARRTISKYRNILKIPSSQKRRNHYSLGLRSTQNQRSSNKTVNQ